MNDLFLIRHGQASFGKENYDRLSQLGIRQSQVLAQHLMRVRKVPLKIYSGCLNRHYETSYEYTVSCSAVNGSSLPLLTKLDLFNEYDAETIWMKYLPMVQDQYPELVKLQDDGVVMEKLFPQVFAKVMEFWISGDHEISGVPSWSNFKQRVWLGLEEIMSLGELGTDVVVFTSSGPISVAIQAALGLSDEKTLKLFWQIFNASITSFKYSQHEITLTGFNEIGHLEIEDQKNLLTYK